MSINAKISQIIGFLEKCFGCVAVEKAENTSVITLDFSGHFELEEITMEFQEITMELNENALQLPEIENLLLAA